MFLLFHLHRPDVLPLGDLGIRKGIAKFFNTRGAGKMGSLHEKKDKEMMEALFEPYRPYRR